MVGTITELRKHRPDVELRIGREKELITGKITGELQGTEGKCTRLQWLAIVTSSAGEYHIAWHRIQWHLRKRKPIHCLRDYCVEA